MPPIEGSSARPGAQATVSEAAPETVQDWDSSDDPSSPELITPPEEFTPQLMMHMLVAEVAGQREQLPLASGQYRLAAMLSHDPRVAERAMRIALFARRYGDALATAQRWLSLDKTNVEAQRWVVVLAIHTDQQAVALRGLERMIEHGEVGIEDFTTVVKLLAAPKYRQRLKTVMQILASRYPKQASVVLLNGRLALEAGDNTLALKYAKNALQLKPDWDDARLLQAQALMLSGNRAAAVHLLSALVEEKPKAAALRLSYAQALVAMQQLEAAREQFRILVEQTSENADIVYAYALMLLETDRLDQAETQLKRVLHLGQRTDDARYYLGRLAERRGDLKRAIAAYRQVNGGEHVIDAHLRLAELWGRQGQLQRGREHLHELRKNNPSLALPLYEGEAQWLRRLGKYKAAMEVYRQGLEQYPNNRDMKYDRALLAEKVGRLDVLEKDLLDILKKNPEDANALNALGYTLADRTDRLTEALGYIKRAYAINPQEPAILDSMGWINYRLGKLDVAIDYLRKALKALDDPEIAAHLGEVLWQKGQHDEARALWQRASKTFPDNAPLKAVIKRFLP